MAYRSPLAIAALLAACHRDEPVTPEPEPELEVTVVTRGTDLTIAPLAAATVALDTPDGVRLEATTDADGIAVFEASWDDGPHVITVDPGLRDQPLLTRTVTAADADLPFVFDVVEVPETVLLSGLLIGRSPDTYLGVIVEALGGGNQDFFRAELTYAVYAPRGEPFELLTYEFINSWNEGLGRWQQPTTNWQRIAVDALDGGTSLDLTVQWTETASAGAFTLDLPEDLRGEDGLSHPYPYARVFSAQSRYTNPQGWPVGMQRSLDGSSFSMGMEWLDDADWPLMTRIYRTRSPDRDSLMQIRGTPDEVGRVALLPLPVLASPNLLAVDRPVDFLDVPADARPVAELFRGDPVTELDAPVLWRVTGAPGADAVAFPEPPSTVDEAHLEPGDRYLRPGLRVEGTAPDWVDGAWSYDVAVPLD